jgi:SAM-dependent methyltransferase
MVKNKKYRRFYDQIDRDKDYGICKNAKEHSIYNVLIKIIDQYVLKDKRVLEIGSGNGRFQDIVKDYTGIDVSNNLRKFYHKPFFVVEDGKPYPFQNESFDFVFTYAVFEHIPNINLALLETIRITKAGGIIFFNPAWQCRIWAAEGYQVRPYSDFNIFGKIYKTLIPVRETLLFRSMHVVPKRLFFLLLFLINPRFFKEKLFYRKLKANYDTFWQSDSDACNSIDPFFAILFFKANGFRIINYPTLISQFLIRTGGIVLRKD